MSYQECPVCKGTGKDMTKLVVNKPAPTCTVCNGSRIIDRVTGLPPIKVEVATIDLSTINLKEL